MDIAKLKQEYYNQKDAADILYRAFKWAIKRCKPAKDIKLAETQCRISYREAGKTYRKLFAAGAAGFKI